ncbi:helix-hairpin-helix domain-containing protein [Mycoplasmopsis californica]|nr:helix-hairpin-helix domain-containing protein [Mycoplasmopsis californica]
MRKKLWILGTVSAVGFFGLALSLTFDQKQTYIQKQIEQNELKEKSKTSRLNKKIITNQELKVNKVEDIVGSIKTNKPPNKKMIKTTNFNEKEEKNKISWKEIKSTKQLISLGISRSVATKLVKYRKSNHETSWENIGKIKGIGAKTIEKLKIFLIL